MSSDTVTLKVKAREVSGKKVKAGRREGNIPGVINERNKDSVIIVAELNPLTKAWHTAGGNHMVELDVDGKKKTVMFKHVTLSPVRGTIDHFVVQAIKQNESVEAEVPVEITGEIPAEKVGLFLVHHLDTILVKALPANLPGKIEISGEGLAEAGDMLKVEDLQVDSKVEILTESDRPIVIVEEPRAAVETESEEGEETEAGEVPSEHGSDDSADTEASNKEE